MLLGLVGQTELDSMHQHHAHALSRLQRKPEGLELRGPLRFEISVGRVSRAASDYSTARGPESHCGESGFEFADA